MKNYTLYSLVSLSFVILISFFDAHARVNFTNDQAAFNVNNPNLLKQNFQASNQPQFGGSPCQPPINQFSDDACFMPGDILPDIEFIDVPGPTINGMFVAGADFAMLNNNPPNVLGHNTIVEALDVVFSNSPTAVSFILGCLTNNAPIPDCSESILIQVFDELMLIGETVVEGDDFVDTFLGIESSRPITRINFQFVNPVVIKAVVLSEVNFGQGRGVVIPTLSEWGLIATASVMGVIGILAVRRKKTIS
ncbi:MAG: IPTL-CTERM sorting domain-containing protein [Thermodesulfobacteriota bacterium]